VAASISWSSGAAVSLGLSLHASGPRPRDGARSGPSDQLVRSARWRETPAASSPTASTRSSNVNWLAHAARWKPPRASRQTGGVRLYIRAPLMEDWAVAAGVAQRAAGLLHRSGRPQPAKDWTLKLSPEGVHDSSLLGLRPSAPSSDRCSRWLRGIAWQGISAVRDHLTVRRDVDTDLFD
jgi:hypothetical protein